MLLYTMSILSLPAHPALPSSERDCEGRAGFSSLFPLPLFLSFPLAHLWLIVAVSLRQCYPASPGAVGK